MNHVTNIGVWSDREQYLKDTRDDKGIQTFNEVDNNILEGNQSKGENEVESEDNSAYVIKHTTHKWEK